MEKIKFIHYKNVSGIYSVTNKQNNFIYFAFSMNLQYALKDLYGRLRTNRHRCKSLQLAYNILGENCFKITIIPITTSKKELSQRVYNLKQDIKHNYNSIRKKYSKYKIAQYTKNFQIIAIWDNIHDAADKVFRSHQAIRACCKQRTKYCAGFIWRYI